MNLDTLFSSLPSFEDIRLIGKTAEFNGSTLDIVGAVLKAGVVNIYAIQYNEEWYEQKCESEELQFSESLKTHEKIRRDRILNEIKFSHDFPNIALRRITVGGRVFDISSSGSTLMDGISIDETLMLAEFLKLGYIPNEVIRYKDFENLYFSYFELCGSFNKIPSELSTTPITLTTARNSKLHLTSKKLKLKTGKKYPHAMSFSDRNSGEKHSFYIENVTLMDVWTDMEKQFDDPRFTSIASPEQIQHAKTNMEFCLNSMCPRNMRLPVIEYEADSSISLEFFLTAHLDSSLHDQKYENTKDIPANSKGNSSDASAVGIIGGSDGPTAIVISSSSEGLGKHGIKLRSYVIQTPVPENTEDIEVEMLRFYQNIPSEDIVIQ